MNKKPVIGISPNYSYETKEYSLHEDYVLAIEKAGGTPVALFPHQELPDFLDGIVLSGGGALLGGLPALISKVTHLKVSIAKNPLDCSVLGLGRLLEYTGDVDRLIRFRTK